MWEARDWRDFFAERAAVLEYEAGYAREDAEALQTCFEMWLWEKGVRGGRNRFPQLRKK